MEKEQIYDVLNEAYFSEAPHEHGVVQRLPALLKDDTLLVDVGASLGQYTRAMCRAVSRSSIYALEADPIRVEQLIRNCEEWSRESTNTVTALAYAVSDHKGPIPYFVTNSDVSGGLDRHDIKRTIEWQEIEVEATTLDDLFPDRIPDLVKIDVEGAELAVLRVARRILEARRTTFLVEIHDWSSDRDDAVTHLMRSAGFRRASFYGQPIFVPSLGAWIRLLMRELLFAPRTTLGRWRRQLFRRQ